MDMLLMGRDEPTKDLDLESDDTYACPHIS
jgi:hypothetical protein